MKLVYSEFGRVIDTNCDRINTVVIENQFLFRKFVSSILELTDDGCISIYSREKEVTIDKYCEMITSFVPFEINKKPLINKLITSLGNRISTSEFYERAAKIIADIELLLTEAAISIEGNIDISDINPLSIVKYSSPRFADDFDSLSEKILEYFKLVYEYEGERLFILVNYRSYISDNEFDLFLKEVRNRGIHIICVDNKEYPRVEIEERYIIDKDLCEI